MRSRAQTLHRSWQRELCAAETLDEVAAPAHAKRLQLCERTVQSREATGNALGGDLLARQHAIALEQQLGKGATTPTQLLDSIRPAALLARHLSGEERERERPAALHLRARAKAARAQRGAAKAPSPAQPSAARARRSRKRMRGERLARCAQGGPGVVGHLAGPYEVPQCLREHGAGHLQLGEQVGEEAGSRGQTLT